ESNNRQDSKGQVEKYRVRIRRDYCVRVLVVYSENSDRFQSKRQAEQSDERGEACDARGEDFEEGIEHYEDVCCDDHSDIDADGFGVSKSQDQGFLSYCIRSEEHTSEL